MDAYLKPLNITLDDGTVVTCKRRGLKIMLAVGDAKGTGLIRRLAVVSRPSRDAGSRDQRGRSERRSHLLDRRRRGLHRTAVVGSPRDGDSRGARADETIERRGLMSTIAAGSITALYFFDVAEAVALDGLIGSLGAQATPARLDDKMAGPPRVQYAQAPVIVDGSALGCARIDEFRVRVKFFDYGVVSLMLTRPFAGSWQELVALGQALIENEPLEDLATAACHDVVTRLSGAFTNPRTTYSAKTTWRLPSPRSGARCLP